MKHRKQIAALPIRFNKKGKLQVLMVTSRETRRWVVPKGWPMDGEAPWRAAEIEAMEEAGVTGTIAETKIGTFRYKKRMADGSVVRCKVALYPMEVEKLRKRWPERHQRVRRWFSPKKAARRVREPQLQEILRALSTKSARKPIRRLIRNAA